MFQDPLLWSIPVGSKPKLDNLDALLAADSPGLDKLPLPYLSSSIPAFLARFLQLPTSIIVVSPVVCPFLGRGGRVLSMSYGVVASHESSAVGVRVHL